MEKKFFTVQEAAELLGLREITVRRRIKAGLIKDAEINSKKHGYRIPYESLISYAKIQSPNNTFLCNNPSSSFATTDVVANILNSVFDNEKTIKAFGDPIIVQKLIERLLLEVNDFDLKIEFQNFKISKIPIDSDLYMVEMEVLFRLRLQKSEILKKIKELEIYTLCIR